MHKWRLDNKTDGIIESSRHPVQAPIKMLYYFDAELWSPASIILPSLLPVSTIMLCIHVITLKSLRS